MNSLADFFPLGLKQKAFGLNVTDITVGSNLSTDLSVDRELRSGLTQTSVAFRQFERHIWKNHISQGGGFFHSVKRELYISEMCGTSIGSTCNAYVVSSVVRHDSEHRGTSPSRYRIC